MKTQSLVALVVVGLVSFAVVGCTSTVESSGNGPNSTSAASNDGAYKGRYDGDDSGPVRMTLADDDIDVVATVSGKDYPGHGKLSSDGHVRIGIGVSQNVTVTFDGKFTNGAGSGTWSSSVGTNGSWSVAK